MAEKLDSWVAGWLDGRVAGRLGSWMAEQLDGWAAGRQGGWSNGRLEARRLEGRATRKL
jgi:hypothetical protein